MQIVALVLIVLAFLFGFVVAFGAPYLPTLNKQTVRALDMLDLRPGQTLLELGCGDGRVARAAAERGITVVGYELNPILVLIAKLNTLKYRKLVTIKLANFWQVTWPPTDAIFVFLLDKYMGKLDKKIVQQVAAQGKPLKLLSYTFQVPGRKAITKKGGLFLYEY
jgi:ribosomal protein L11 methylase PrmA